MSLKLKIFHDLHCILNNVPEYFFMGLTIGAAVVEREKQQFIMEK